MVIDKDTYKLNESNFYSKEFDKTQIVLGNSFSTNLNHVKGWEKRYNGDYKKTAMFSIDRKGNIYQHFDPKYYSDFLNNKRNDKKIISIIVENQGWLKKDLLKDRYIDWVGNIYKRRVKVFEKRWRGFMYWDPYTPKQYKSITSLIEYLCEIHSISPKCVGHNTYIDGIEGFQGITYRSNYYKEKTDLNPSWDFKKFKNKIEKK